MDSPIDLDIANLPPAITSMAPGCLYLVVCDSDALIHGLLFVNLPGANATPAVFCCDQTPGRQHDTRWLDRRMLSGSLTLLSPKGSARPALTECLEELSHARDPLRRGDENELLVLGNAEKYLGFDHPDAASRELRAATQWAEEKRRCVLLLANRQRLDMAAQAILAKAASLCAGLALAQKIGAGVYSWQTEHWMGAGAAAEAQTHVLGHDVSGALRLLREEPDALAARPALDLFLVHATRASLDGNTPPPPQWQLYDDLPALTAAAGGAVAATVLLDTGTSQRETLADAVSGLRRQCGSRLKILVRESGNRRLRRNEEQLLLQLGANLVLPAELRFASAVSLIHALQPAVYQRRNHLEPQTLRHASLPPTDRGYLPPARFAEMVRKTVQRSGAIQISSTLVILSPAGGIRPWEMLAPDRFRRTGDLCTADTLQAYLFLFACGEADVPAALRNQFRLPVTDLADSETRCPDNASILQALTRLENQPDPSPPRPRDGARAASAKGPARVALRRQPLRRRDKDGETIDV
ncbi:cellulose biosynthesis protein BcsE [Chromobacterium violaceum]|uniref:cellulose biosynthesis protein BcsE n=1 Tax=Chromobacterium violaceum TaxID=536 RepID=UPI0009D9D6C0|nr:cellulose biosynthesis protein BcsE [Chromobacterium violaceum]OQS44658.1 cellulose biosynthesis protein BcsE [Chromobacterium violaceum]OQS45722.1 cellulose biosynthesis protein BcsE [Chromobacterium violaceum]QRO33707.1 cellulose biosynthesis protein BcsE [Chromobacterium violaceum]QRQ16489.1 cellulose biosynthesis protein BcsE [Chromobacterium violaceum]